MYLREYNSVGMDFVLYMQWLDSNFRFSTYIYIYIYRPNRSNIYYDFLSGGF